MALVGAWLSTTSRRSGEYLLRSRLDESLVAAARTIGSRWVDVRSTLLRLADGAADGTIDREWPALAGIADEAMVRDRAGHVVRTLRRDGAGAPASDLTAQPTFLTSFPVYDGSGAVTGFVDVRVFVGQLLPSPTLVSGVGGSMFALFDSTGQVPLLPTPVDPAVLGSDRFSYGGEEWLVSKFRLSEPAVVLALASPLTPFTQPFSRATRQGAILLGLVLAGAMILATTATTRLTVPLRQLARASDAVATGDLDQHVPEQGPSDVRRVSRAFNVMTESLRHTMRRLAQREAVAAVGEFAAALAHEVRNPLTAIRLDLERASERLTDERAARELLERAVAEIDRLDATVTGSLRVARTGDLALSEIDLREPVRNAMRVAEPRFAARGATLDSLDACEPVLARAHAHSVEQLVLNLLLNAADALAEGGHAAVELSSVGGGARLAVRDDGAGIAAADLPRVLDPFFTTKDGGTGLGLAVARRIAEAHGAELRIESEIGRGTRVELSLNGGENAPAA
jgi:signal transduction histidine kinase